MKYLILALLVVSAYAEDVEISIEDASLPMINLQRIGYAAFGDPRNQMFIPKPPQRAIDHFNSLTDEDFPVDYSMRCSNTCGCRQTCVIMWWVPCSCMCPPPCATTTQAPTTFPQRPWQPRPEPNPPHRPWQPQPEPIPPQNNRPWQPQPPIPEPIPPQNNRPWQPAPPPPLNPQFPSFPNIRFPSQTTEGPLTHPPQPFPTSNPGPQPPVWTPEPIWPQPDPQWPWQNQPQPQPIWPNPQPEPEPQWPWQNQPQPQPQPDPIWPWQPNPQPEPEPQWPWQNQPQPQPIWPNPQPEPEPQWPWQQNPQPQPQPDPIWPWQPNPQPEPEPQWPWQPQPNVPPPRNDCSACNNQCSCTPCSVIWVCPPACPSQCCNGSCGRHFADAENYQDAIEAGAVDTNSNKIAFHTIPEYLRDIFIPGLI